MSTGYEVFVASAIQIEKEENFKLNDRAKKYLEEFKKEYNRMKYKPESKSNNCYEIKLKIYNQDKPMTSEEYLKVGQRLCDQTISLIFDYLVEEEKWPKGQPKDTFKCESEFEFTSSFCFVVTVRLFPLLGMAYAQPILPPPPV